MEVPEEIRLALQIARQTARGTGKIATFAKEMEHILERGVKQIELAELPAVGRHASKGGEELVTYVVDRDRGHGESLGEHRTSGRSKPFRCPRRVYDALAGVMAGTERPLALDEIMVAVEKVSGQRPPDYQLRVALRFWMHVKPNLVIRNRARYQAPIAQEFKSTASSVWKSLAVGN